MDSTAVQYMLRVYTNWTQLPPINTGAPGYPAHPQQPVGYPPQGGPPGYPPQAPPGQYGAGGYGAPPPVPAAHGPPAAYNRPGMAEAPGEGRSKAQLIVGIDFVRPAQPRPQLAHAIATLYPRGAQSLTTHRAPPSQASPSPSQPTPRPRRTSSPSGPAQETRPSRR